MAFMNKLTDFAKQAGDKAQDFAKQASELAKTAGDKANDMIEVTKIKAEIRDEEKKIATLKTNIGDTIVKLVGEGADAPSEVQVMVADINAALLAIEEKKALIETFGTSDDAVVEDSIYQAMDEIDKEDEAAAKMADEQILQDDENGEVTISKEAVAKIAEMDEKMAEVVDEEVVIDAEIEEVVEEAKAVVAEEKPNFAEEMSFTTKKEEA